MIFEHQVNVLLEEFDGYEDVSNYYISHKGFAVEKQAMWKAGSNATPGLKVKFQRWNMMNRTGDFIYGILTNRELPNSQYLEILVAPKSVLDQYNDIDRIRQVVSILDV